ncbi:14595_t:CDS:2, partial [Cetraspora pellucida]
MYELDELSEKEYEVNLFDLFEEQEAFEAALKGNPIAPPVDWNEEEIFYLTEEPEENENYSTIEDFYFRDNPWSDVESLNGTEIPPVTNEDMNQEPEMHKGVQTEKDLEIVKQTLHNKLSPALLDKIFLQELTETEPADVIIEPSSYDQKDKTRTKVHLTYQALRSMARLRNHEDSRLKALTYAYYLGELLETKPKTPAQRTVL